MMQVALLVPSRFTLFDPADADPEPHDPAVDHLVKLPLIASRHLDQRDFVTRYGLHVCVFPLSTTILPQLSNSGEPWNLFSSPC